MQQNLAVLRVLLGDGTVQNLLYLSPQHGSLFEQLCILFHYPSVLRHCCILGILEFTGEHIDCLDKVLLVTLLLVGGRSCVCIYDVEATILIEQRPTLLLESGKWYATVHVSQVMYIMLQMHKLIAKKLVIRLETKKVILQLGAFILMSLDNILQYSSSLVEILQLVAQLPYLLFEVAYLCLVALCTYVAP